MQKNITTASWLGVSGKLVKNAGDEGGNDMIRKLGWRKSLKAFRLAYRYTCSDSDRRVDRGLALFGCVLLVPILLCLLMSGGTLAGLNITMFVATCVLALFAFVMASINSISAWRYAIKNLDWLVDEI